MRNRIEINMGDIFNRLTVICDGVSINKRVKYKCLCECGNSVLVDAHALKSGNTKSCGCYFTDVMDKLHSVHNRCGTPEYRSWQLMLGRCYRKNNHKYPKYGAVGIIVCERWRHSFENFFSDMGEKPSNIHTLDRFPNNKGNYEPGNVRWATPKEQSGNIITNRWLEHDGRKMIMSDWARELGIGGRSQEIYYYFKKGKSFSWIYSYFLQKQLADTTKPKK